MLSLLCMMRGVNWMLQSKGYYNYLRGRASQATTSARGTQRPYTTAPTEAQLGSKCVCPA
nr:Uncharacterised protein [Raoultella sp. NCTC 9187]